MRAVVAFVLGVGPAACGAGNSSPANSPGGGDDAGADAALGDDARDGAALGDAGYGPNLHVEGGHLVYQGKPTRLLGVDHSGSEYACVQQGGYSVFEGFDPDNLATGLLMWGHVNAVRLPLNEDCWLGINGVNAQYAGSAYESAVRDYANKLHARGLFVILDLHWNAPGSFLATSQQPMADADHAVDFWRSVAGAFKGDGMTVFDLYNEPHVDTSNAQTTDNWACWLNGCTITKGEPNSNVQGNWQSAGMQSLIDAVRSAGATNVVMLGGLAYADDLSGWLAHVPRDPLGQIAASFHLYDANTCVTRSCWDSVVAPIAQQYPVVAGEIGEKDCAHGFVDSFMPWADSHGVSYLAWTWNVWNCASGPALITDYYGTPTAFGQGVKDHLLVTSP